MSGFLDPERQVLRPVFWVLVQAPSVFTLSCLTDSSSAWHCLWRGEKGEEKTAQNPWRSV